jgi:small nuclear ribonucleoprotein (snRNP)-like protein
VGALFLLVNIFNRSDKRDGGGDFMACTKEALICPDGSSVGRGGPNCDFDACPNVDFIEGELVERDGSYWIITSAPDTAGEATYIFPLEEKSNNSLKNLLGKQVRVRGSFSKWNNLVIDTIEELSKDKTIGNAEVGKTVFINGLKITLIEVLQDNRCPSDDVRCIEGGAITARFNLVSDTETLTRNIASDEVPTPFDAYTIAIEEIAPIRVSAKDPNLSEYVLTLRVVNIND